ncbi:MAG: Transcription elongation factor GreB [Verrucomicrobiae bacterium]|nr:Transcription elongation factor GreB [Verrucomicrobiae bacterium]
MSRAFVRESDDTPERPPVRSSPLPPGVPNYITPAGARRLGKQLPSDAVIVPPPTEPTDQVRFGATVTVKDADGETTYRLVGVDETDTDQNWISWISPLAKALLNARVGQCVKFRNAELEIISVSYR